MEPVKQQALKTSVQLKKEKDSIIMGYICIEGETYNIPPAVTACFIDVLDEIDELYETIEMLKYSDYVARS